MRVGVGVDIGVVFGNFFVGIGFDVGVCVEVDLDIGVVFGVGVFFSLDIGVDLLLMLVLAVKDISF